MSIHKLFSDFPGSICHEQYCATVAEETAGVNLFGFIARNKDHLRADKCRWEFGGVDHRDVPMSYPGLQGPASKTVLAARASAKVDFRLVPDQHPDDILLPIATGRLGYLGTPAHAPKETLTSYGAYIYGAC